MNWKHSLKNYTIYSINSFNVICLQECSISDQTYSLNIQLPGYDCITQIKSSSDRGGLRIYVDNKFQYGVCLNLNMYEHWEGQIIYPKGGGLPKPIIIGNIYRPPRIKFVLMNSPHSCCPLKKN